MSRIYYGSPVRSSSRSRSRPEQGSTCDMCPQWEALNSRLRSENHTLEEEVGELRKSVDDLSEVVRRQETDLKLLSSQKQELLVENGRLSTESLELHQQLDQVKMDLFLATAGKDTPRTKSEFRSEVHLVSPAGRKQLQELSKERDELAVTNIQLAKGMDEIRMLLRDLESRWAWDAESSARLKAQLKECESLRYTATHVVQLPQDALASPFRRMLFSPKESGTDSRNPRSSVDAGNLESQLEALQDENAFLKKELRQVEDSALKRRAETASRPESSAQVARMAEALQIADQNYAAVKQKVGELETQLEKSIEAVSEKDAELLRLRNMLRNVRTDCRHMEKESSGEGGEREFIRLSGSYFGSPNNPQRPEGENSVLIAENVRLLHENDHLNTMVQELSNQVVSLQASRGVVRENPQRFEARREETARIKALESELGAARSSIFELEVELAAAREKLSTRIQPGPSQREHTMNHAQYTAENRYLVEELKSAERKLSEKDELVSHLQSSIFSKDSLILQSSQEILVLRASIGRLEITNGQLEAALVSYFEEIAFLSSQFEKLLHASNDAKREEVARLQQEILSLSRKIQLQAKEHDLAMSSIKQDHDRLLEECASHRAEIRGVRGTALSENSHLKDQLSACSTQLQEAKLMQQTTGVETARLQQEISKLIGEARQAQLQARDREVAFDIIKQDREQCVGESAKLRVECSKLREEIIGLRAEVDAANGAALKENFRLNSELKACATQREQESKSLHQKQQEVARLQQEISALKFSAQDRELAFVKLARDQDQYLKERNGLQAEVAAHRGAFQESTRLKEELKVCMAQLEQARNDERAKREEAIRLKDELSTQNLLIRKAQLKAQEQEKSLDQTRDELTKTQGVLTSVRAAASTETSRLQEELKVCVSQLEKARIEQQAKSEEAIRLQQEISTLTVTLRQAQLQAQDREMVFEKLKQDREQCLDESAKVRGELASVRAAANTERSRLTEELKACTNQLEQARSEQQAKSEEMIRLQQEVTTLTVSIRQAQLQAQDREVAFEKLKQDRE
eukprot:RCo041965